MLRTVILDNYQTDLAANIHILAGLHLFLWTDFNLIVNALSRNKIVSTLCESKTKTLAKTQMKLLNQSVRQKGK